MDLIKTILAVGAGKSLATASLIIGKVKSAEMFNFVFDKCVSREELLLRWPLGRGSS